MKFTINNNLRLLTCPLLLAGAVCCSSGNDGDTPAPGPGPDPSPVTGDVLAYVTSADGTHPSDLGYWRWAQNLQPELLKVLKKHGIR